MPELPRCVKCVLVSTGRTRLIRKEFKQGMSSKEGYSETDKQFLCRCVNCDRRVWRDKNPLEEQTSQPKKGIA